MVKKSGKTRRRAQYTTLLAVGEGAHDAAFLRHMKSLYDSRHNGQKLTIKAAGGGSPLSIFKAVRGKYRNHDYDKTFVLLDGDVQVDKAAREYARKHRMEWLLSTPLCLEGMLLQVLRQSVPSVSADCKKHLHPQLSGPPTDPASYHPLFDLNCLNSTSHQTLVCLRQVFARSK